MNQRFLGDNPKKCCVSRKGIKNSVFWTHTYVRNQWTCRFIESSVSCVVTIELGYRDQGYNVYKVILVKSFYWL